MHAATWRPKSAEAATAHYLKAMRQQGTPVDETAYRSRDGRDGSATQRKDRRHLRPPLQT